MVKQKENLYLQTKNNTGDNYNKMTQLTYKDFETLYQPLISSNDAKRKLNLFYLVNGLPQNLKCHENPVYLAGGMPFESMFPVQEIDLQIRDNPGSLTDDQVLSKNYSITKIKMYENEEKIKETESTKMIPVNSMIKGPSKVGLSYALQYSEVAGFPELLELTRQIITRINKPKYDMWDTLLTCGTSDSLAKICDMLIDDNSTMLMEEFTFTPVLHNLQYSGGKHIPLKLNVTSDQSKQGIDPEYMSDLLDNFDKKYPGLQKPKVLYTIATGHNPTGLTQTMENRQKIYDICSKHNIIIIEDDPYGYLQLPKYDESNPLNNPYSKGEISVDQYCKEILIPSYLTIDDDGRVLRCETFSKVGAPGLRLGFITGNKFLIDKLTKLTHLTVRNPSGVSQAVLTNMLIDMGQKYQALPGNENAPFIDGWIEWCMKISGQYTTRRNYMFQSLYEQPAFKEKKFELIEPTCGMFFNTKIVLKPEWSKKETKRIMDYLYCCLLEEGCLAVLGYKMTIDEDFSLERANFLRFTFAKANTEQLFKEGAERFSNAVERLFNEYGVDEKFDLAPQGFVE